MITEEKDKRKWEERETIIEQLTYIEIPMCLTRLLSLVFFQLTCIADLTYNIK